MNPKVIIGILLAIALINFGLERFWQADAIHYFISPLLILIMAVLVVMYWKQTNKNE